MNESKYRIAIAQQSEYPQIGALMAEVYAQLDGFPSRDEQPGYYSLFDDLASLVSHEETEVITARRADGQLVAGVVYFGDMKHYGSGGTATTIENASGLRLLAVHASARGDGIGRKLTKKCIALANEKNHKEVILHTTECMTTAWAMYAKMGFARYEFIDFLQAELSVFGFRLTLRRNDSG